MQTKQASPARFRAHAPRLLFVLALALMLFLCALPAQAASFLDVPADHWAAADIEELRALGISDGVGDGRFGVGETLTRAQFAAFLAKLEGYDEPSPQAYSDNTDPGAWYYSTLNAMAAHRVTSPEGAFRPDEPITRAEMAEFLTGALGFYDLGNQLNQIACPFSDVQSRKGCITLASDIGLMGGMGGGTFAPDATATREQAAATLVRLYHLGERQLQELHGFYAISSASQSSFLTQLDSTGFGWARLTLRDGHALVSTTVADGNEYFIPDGFTAPVAQARQHGKALLSVYADNNSGLLTQLLGDPALRGEAVQQVVTEMNGAGRDGETVRFDGVVIDFESLRAAEKSSFTAFLQELRSAMGTRPLYVTVHPVLSGSAYYDGYDYAAIGALADRVILMAYDYDARALTETEMAQGYTMTPLTPLNQVYTSIRACLNGGIPAQKLLLGLSPNTSQWKLQNGAVLNSTPYRPAYDAVAARLATGCSVDYPNYSYNPCARYFDERDGTENVLWFENAQSVTAKAELARLLGLEGLSVWRLGTIPTDASQGLDIWSAISSAVR